MTTMNTTRNATAPFALILSLILTFGPVAANALAAGCSGGTQAVTGESVQLCGTTVVHADETSALRISLTDDVRISAADLGSESQIEIVGDGTAPAVMVTKTDSGEGMFHAVAFPDGYSDSDSRAGLIEPMEPIADADGFLEAGDYVLYVVTDPGVPVTATIRFDELDGSTQVHPETTADASTVDFPMVAGLPDPGSVVASGGAERETVPGSQFFGAVWQGPDAIGPAVMQGCVYLNSSPGAGGFLPACPTDDGGGRVVGFGPTIAGSYLFMQLSVEESTVIGASGSVLGASPDNPVGVFGIWLDPVDFS